MIKKPAVPYGWAFFFFRGEEITVVWANGKRLFFLLTCSWFIVDVHSEQPRTFETSIFSFKFFCKKQNRYDLSC